MCLKNMLILVVLFVFISATDVFSNKRPVNWVEYHSAYLSSRGIADFSDNSLITLLKETKDTSIAYHTVLLLGRKKVDNAVSAMEEWLIKENINVRIAAAEALLMLDNTNGIKTLKEICQNYEGAYALDATGVLARYGFIDAIPYLENFGKSEIYSYRLSALEHMRSLSEKLQTELKANKKKKQLEDKVEYLINKMIELLSDKDIRVRRRAFNLLSIINIQNKTYIIKELKRKVGSESDPELAAQIRKGIELLETKQQTE
ncbi:MAG: HEAT repeat domain-containing protein [Desulfobacteraceae bacterium]|nr:HEAT repeat domain-containing protein [Desulfobacteraceae bacterium]